MKANGEVGHFLADHVSEELEPLTNLKEKVQSGKAKASEMHISEPTSMSHEYHWGRDGNKWVAEETDDSPSLARYVPTSEYNLPPSLAEYELHLFLVFCLR